MKKHKPKHAAIPGLGLRSIKTAISASLVAFIYCFLEGRNPTFACIGAVFGTGTNYQDSKLNGGNRLIGTILGGFLGMGMFWVEHAVFEGGNYFFRIPLLFVGIIILVICSVAFKWPGAVQPGGVVFCIILFNTPENYIWYALDRMLDTGIGVVIAWLVNMVIPREFVEKVFRLEPSVDQ
ncbi:MAG: aromatic acid exporter family protein [Clostridia bacterium]